MIVGKAYLLGLSLILKEVVDILDEGHEVGFRHAHLHLPLINLSEVHHLIDKTQYSLGIAFDGLIHMTTVGVIVILDE